MFTISYKNLSAKIRPFGAELASFKIDRTEYIWEADPAFWSKSSPLLFPSIGFLKDGKTVINGKEYRIPKHGFARDNEFDCEKAAENVLKCTLKQTEQTLAVFPFKFELTLIYTLSDNGLTIEYRVLNRNDSEMPFCFGLHPAFKCPISKNEAFDDYNIVFEKPETLDAPLISPDTGVINLLDRTTYMDDQTVLPLNYSMFERDALIFEELNSRSLTLTNGEHSVKLAFDGFTSLGLWTPINAPFICIEPWCGMNDRTEESGIFSEKFGVQTLSPDKAKTFTLNIQPN